MENQNQLTGIFSRYLHGECSPEEVKLLLHHFAIAENEQELRKLITQVLEENSDNTIENTEMNAVYHRVYRRINQTIENRKEKPVIPLYKQAVKWIAAAVVLLVLSVGLYHYSQRNKQDAAIALTGKGLKDDIAPGGNKATLTLDDGRTIVLSDVENGILSNEGQTSVSKIEDGQLVYDASGLQSPADKVAYNTITTPRGGEYTVVLPDGSKVWLNAASSLRFPTAFSGNERNVELTGEAYFEVAHNRQKPFKVISSGQAVEVLGTHFNIMAYTDETIRETTLLEGSVRISRLSAVGSRQLNDSRILKPGQQARIENNGLIQVVNADVEESVAWKNGYFQFNRDNIENIMKQLARWYDIEVVYEGEIPKDEFVGKIRRQVTLSQALKMLQLSRMQFQIEGRKIIVKG